MRMCLLTLQRSCASEASASRCQWPLPRRNPWAEPGYCCDERWQDAHLGFRNNPSCITHQLRIASLWEQSTWSRWIWIEAEIISNRPTALIFGAWQDPDPQDSASCSLPGVHKNSGGFSRCVSLSLEQKNLTASPGSSFLLLNAVFFFLRIWLNFLLHCHHYTERSSLSIGLIMNANGSKIASVLPSSSDRGFSHGNYFISLDLNGSSEAACLKKSIIVVSTPLDLIDPWGVLSKSSLWSKDSWLTWEVRITCIGKCFDLGSSSTGLEGDCSWIYWLEIKAQWWRWNWLQSDALCDSRNLDLIWDHVNG